MTTLYFFSVQVPSPLPPKLNSDGHLPPLFGGQWPNRYILDVQAPGYYSVYRIRAVGWTNTHMLVRGCTRCCLY